MTVASCEICKGARVLPMGLGRCVCVTPEAMLALEKALDRESDLVIAICEALGLMDDAGLADKVTAYVEAVNETYSAVTAGRVTSGPPENLKATVDAALDEIHDGAAEALSDYLVSVGLPAHPTGALENPALERLVQTIH